MRLKCCAAVLGLGGWVALAAASPAVVADSACPLHAVDIAAFATCEGDRVAMPDEDLTAEPGPTEQAQAIELNASDQTVERPNS